MGVILLRKDDLTTSFLRRQESRVVGAVREPPAPCLCEPFSKPGEEKARQSTHSSDHITHTPRGCPKCKCLSFEQKNG